MAFFVLSLFGWRASAKVELQRSNPTTKAESTEAADTSKSDPAELKDSTDKVSFSMGFGHS